MSDVLVDSSAWIDFFHGNRASIVRIDELLADDRAAVSGPIVAEVTSGARNLASFNQLRARFRALNLLVDPPALWDHVAEARFALVRQGIQAHLIDLSIAVTANARGHSVLTRDKDFLAIGRVVPIDLDVY